MSTFYCTPIEVETQIYLMHGLMIFAAPLLARRTAGQRCGKTV
jgi:hypothetical protein